MKYCVFTTAYSFSQRSRNHAGFLPLDAHGVICSNIFIRINLMELCVSTCEFFRFLLFVRNELNYWVVIVGKKMSEEKNKIKEETVRIINE